MDREKLCIFTLGKKGNGKKTELLKSPKESIIVSRVWLMLGFLCVLIFSFNKENSSSVIENYF